MAMAARALALRQRGITVAVINPGWVRTDMGGQSAEVAPEDAAAGLLAVIDGATPAQSGRFLDWRGQTLPW